MIKLAGHLVEVSVGIKRVNRQIQTGDSVRYSSRAALESLLYRYELISKGKRRDRMPGVNLEDGRSVRIEGSLNHFVFSITVQLADPNVAYSARAIDKDQCGCCRDVDIR